MWESYTICQYTEDWNLITSQPTKKDTKSIKILNVGPETMILLEETMVEHFKMLALEMGFVLFCFVFLFCLGGTPEAWATKWKMGWDWTNFCTAWEATEGSNTVGECLSTAFVEGLLPRTCKGFRILNNNHQTIHLRKMKRTWITNILQITSMKLGLVWCQIL